MTAKGRRMADNRLVPEIGYVVRRASESKNPILMNVIEIEVIGGEPAYCCRGIWDERRVDAWLRAKELIVVSRYPYSRHP